jgi:hypothetical protein
MEVALTCAPPLALKALELLESTITPQFTVRVAPPLIENAFDAAGSRV